MRSFPLILSFILVVLFGTAYAELSFPPFESFDKDGNGRIEATEMGGSRLGQITRERHH